MKPLGILFLLITAIFLTACTNNACPEGSVTYVRDASFFSTEPQNTDQRTELQIGNKTMEFDQVIHGQLCNNSLSGTVYIACDVQVVEWEDKPKFLEGCNFKVAPDTVIYVAAHNDAPYYKGCAECH